MSDINLNLNPYQNSFSKKRNRKCIYFSPEDITEKLSGGHFEVLSDIYFLSKIFKKVDIVYPLQNKKSIKNNLLEKILKDSKNINKVPIKTNRTLIGFLFISKNRLDINNYIKENKIDLNDLLFVSCHRNILLHIILYLKYGSKNIIFKSHGSIIKHNLDNIVSCLKLKYKDKYFLKRIVSLGFYLCFENLSFIFSDKVFLMRDKNSIKNRSYLFLLKLKLDNKLFFSCASSLFLLHLKKSFGNYSLKLNNKFKKKKLILGSLADNTFPCNLLGLKIIINNIAKLNKKYGFDIRIRIAGKINKEVIKIIQNKFCIKSNNLEVMGYVDDLNIFYKDLDALLVASAGGSGIPIKIFQSSINFSGPILANNYMENSAGSLINFNKNIFFDPKLFLDFFSS